MKAYSARPMLLVAICVALALAILAVTGARGHHGSAARVLLAAPAVPQAAPVAPAPLVNERSKHEGDNR